jgi:tRNA dimethylallyltransferase
LSPSHARGRVLAIVGPTAVGKSAVAHEVAKRLDGEIVVADPFQRYRGLEIAADSPRPIERAAIRHHLVGDLGLHEASNVAGYAAAAHAAIDDILARGRVPIVSGGTGLYVRAALADLGFPPEPSGHARLEAERMVAESLPAARDRLRELSERSASR